VLAVAAVGTAAYHWQPVVNWRIEREARAHLTTWESTDRSGRMAAVRDGALAYPYDVRSDGPSLAFTIDRSPYGDGYTVRTVESDRAVVLLVIRTHVPTGTYPANAVRGEMSATLRRPLGGRVLFDGATGDRLPVDEPVR
jgi:hypothetical protein